MDYFEQGHLFTAIFFLSAACTAAAAAVKWAERAKGTSTRLLYAGLADLAFRFLIVGAIPIIGGWLVLMFVFPSAIPVIALFLFKDVLLVSVAASVSAVASYWLFSRAQSFQGLVLLTALMVAFYVALGFGMKRLNAHMHDRAAQARLAKDEAEQARKALAAITLATRQEAVRRRVALAPKTEPYISVFRCVEPLLAARAEAHTSQQQWPRQQAGISKLPLDLSCRIQAARADVGGGLRVTTEDDTLAPWGAKVAKPREPHDPPPPPPPLDLYFLPDVDAQGQVRWLCTAPHQPHIATRFPGCGHWTPAGHEWLNLS